MSGKYSAEWWQKIAGLEREIPQGEESPSVVDHFIQATAAPKATQAGNTSEHDPTHVSGSRSSSALKTKRRPVPVA
jgi:hypothetical protein